MAKLECWKKVRNRKFGNNISIVYSKGSENLELFKDSMWGKTDNMNVLVRNTDEKSLEDSWGKPKLVKHMKTKSQAINFANEYMETHDKC